MAEEKKAADRGVKELTEEPKAERKPTKDLLPVASPGSDINFAAIMKVGAGFVIVTSIMAGFMWVLFNYLAAEAKRTDPHLSPLTTNAKQAPPEPRLQITPASDLKQVQEIEHAYLDNYGWVDEKTGVVRIPIKEAKKLIVEKYHTDVQNVPKH